MNETLKQYTIAFGVNTKPLEQGIQKSESTLKKFAKTFNAIAATYFSYKVFQGVIKGFADFNTKLGQSISLSGYSSENVTALGGALKRFGGDTNSAISSLNSLNSALHDAKFGGGALIETAKKYGIAFTDSNGKLMDAETLLYSLGNQLGKYDKQTRVAIASNLGLDESIVRAFSSGNGELKKLIDNQRKFGVISKQDIKISDGFNNAILDLKDSFAGITRALARFILPMLTKLIKLATQFIEFLKRHKQLVIAFFGALLIAMTPILAVFLKMAIASATAFAPIYAVVAVVAGIAAVVEDIYYYFMGWDSVTGDLVKRFPALGKALEFIRPLVMGIADTFSAIVDWIKDPTWDKFVNIFKVAGDAIKTYLLGALDLVKQSLSWIYDKTIGLLSKMGKWIGIGGGDTPAPAPAVVSASGGGQTNNITNNVTQNITSATPKQLADSVNSLAVGSINAQRQQQGGR